MPSNPGNTNPLDVRQAPVSAAEYVALPSLLPEELEELKNTPAGEAKDALWKKINAQRRERAAREAAERVDNEGGSDSASARAVALGETPEQRAARETKERRAKFGIDTLEISAEPQQQSYLIDRFLPKTAVILVVGDSPSRFLIQLGLCVASGTPFLGRSTHRAKCYSWNTSPIQPNSKIPQAKSQGISMSSYPRCQIFFCVLHARQKKS
jgi:hypothetical protein